MNRDELNEKWFALTRDRMPDLAESRDWPVSEDHCFQRILLDNAIGAKWADQIPAPAYIHAPDEVMRRAVELGEAAIEGSEDLAALNANSLAWRGHTPTDAAA